MHRLALLIGSLLLCAATLTGCGSSSDRAEDGATLSAEAFALAITGPDTVVIDVRTPEEYAAGHIPDAMLIDVSDPEFMTKVAALDKTKKYALYCRSGNRSEHAMDVMHRNGFSYVYHLGGGVGAWQRAGKPLVEGR